MNGVTTELLRELEMTKARGVLSTSISVAVGAQTMYRTPGERIMSTSEQLAAELAALEKESAAIDAEDGLTAEERELRAKVRASKLELVAKRAAKKHGKVFPVDMDPRENLPRTVQFQGQECVLHTQFVIRGALKELDAFTAAIQDISDDDPFKHDKRKAATRTLVTSCLVFPTNGDRSHAEHALDIAASFDRFPALEMTLSDEAASLGGMIAKANRKSVG